MLCILKTSQAFQGPFLIKITCHACRSMGHVRKYLEVLPFDNFRSHLRASLPSNIVMFNRGCIIGVAKLSPSSTQVVTCLQIYCSPGSKDAFLYQYQGEFNYLLGYRHAVETLSTQEWQSRAFSYLLLLIEYNSSLPVMATVGVDHPDDNTTLETPVKKYIMIWLVWTLHAWWQGLTMILSATTLAYSQ